MAALTKVSDRPTRIARGIAKRASAKIEKADAKCAMSCLRASIFPCATSSGVDCAVTFHPLSIASNNSLVVNQRSFLSTVPLSLKIASAGNSITESVAAAKEEGLAKLSFSSTRLSIRASLSFTRRKTEPSGLSTRSSRASFA